MFQIKFWTTAFLNLNFQLRRLLLENRDDQRWTQQDASRGPGMALLRFDKSTPVCFEESGQTGLPLP